MLVAVDPARGTERRRALVLCTHNSARSQMAEGFLRALGGARFEVQSAGTEASRVHPLAIRVMGEVGIDLREHTSKTLDRFLGEKWDYVITVCVQTEKRGRRIRSRRLPLEGAHHRFDAILQGEQPPNIAAREQARAGCHASVLVLLGRGVGLD